MQKINRNNIINILFFTLIWIILNEKFTYFVVISGFICSIISLYFTNHYLLNKPYSKTYQLRFPILFKYLAFLLFQIFKSGFFAIPKILKGDCMVKIVEYQTVLTNDLAISLLCNAITLTPGTVTIEKKGNQLKILCFADEIILDSKISSPTFAYYEKILGGIES